MAQITPLAAGQVRDLLREAAPFERLFLRDDPSPWSGTAFRNGQEVQNAFDTAQRLAHETLPSLNARVLDLVRSTSFAEAEIFSALDAASAVLLLAKQILDKYKPAIFSTDLNQIAAALEKTRKGGLKALWLSWTNGEVKAARRQLVKLRRVARLGFRRRKRS